jgi:hypothetical protein
MKFEKNRKIPNMLKISAKAIRIVNISPLCTLKKYAVTVATA